MWLTWEMWGVSALLLLGGELFLQNFVFLWPAVAAGATSIGAVLGLSAQGQLLLFSVGSIVLVALSRTILKAFLFPEEAAELDDVRDLTGRTGEVVARVDGEAPGGELRIDDMSWPASAREGQALEVGQSARVVAIEGATLVVEPAEAASRG
jgi:membrane protein implicated in regulation of membrane protease activity